MEDADEADCRRAQEGVSMRVTKPKKPHHVFRATSDGGRGDSKRQLNKLLEP